MTVTLRVTVEPIDPLLFGDNRSARAGEDHTLADQDPSPATFYGAIAGRIASRLGASGEASWDPAAPVLGRFRPRLDEEDPRGSELLGFTLRGTAGDLWFPRPLHARVERIGRKRFALPPAVPAAGGEDVASSLGPRRRLASHLAAQEDAIEEEDEPLLVSSSLLGQILSASEEAEEADWNRQSERPAAFWAPEYRLGLAMSNRLNTATSGRLFSRPYRRFRTGFTPGSEGLTAGFAAWLRLPGLDGHDPRSWNGLAFLGGDRRRARLTFEPDDDPLAGLRQAVEAAAPESRGFFVYLLTAAVVDGGGPVTLGGREPVAAAVGRSLRASGWSAAGRVWGPRPLRTLLPSGSVLFFEWSDAERAPETRLETLRRHWLAPIDGRFRNAGFGRLLPGVWR